MNYAKEFLAIDHLHGECHKVAAMIRAFLPFNMGVMEPIFVDPKAFNCEFCERAVLVVHYGGVDRSGPVGDWFDPLKESDVDMDMMYRLLDRAGYHSHPCLGLHSGIYRNV